MIWKCLSCGFSWFDGTYKDCRYCGSDNVVVVDDADKAVVEDEEIDS